MCIEYDEYELLELFEAEPSVVIEEELVFMYSKKDDYGFRFIFVLSAYARECSLILSYSKYRLSIFNLELNGVGKVMAINDLDLLVIQSEDGTKKAEIMFKPNFAIKSFKW